MTTKKDLEKEIARLERKLDIEHKKRKEAEEKYETALVFEHRKANKIAKLEKENEELKQRNKKLENALNAIKSALIAKGIYKETTREVA